MKLLLYILFFCLFVFYSCDDNSQYSDVPSVKFKEFRQKDNVLIFSLIDGDGDVGLSKNDTIEPYDKDSEYHYNLYVNFYEKKNKKYSLMENGVFKYRLPNQLNRTGYDKLLESDIELDLSSAVYGGFPDTVKLTFFVYDRALNKSNIAETKELFF